MSGDNDDLPFSRFDRAGRPTPNLFAASVTDMPEGITPSRMKAPGCAGFPDGCDTRLSSGVSQEGSYRVARHNTIQITLFGVLGHFRPADRARAAGGRAHRSGRSGCRVPRCPGRRGSSPAPRSGPRPGRPSVTSCRWTKGWKLEPRIASRPSRSAWLQDVRSRKQVAGARVAAYRILDARNADRT